jgi:hypothetical protein
VITIPDSERQIFESLLLGQAKLFGLAPDEYLRKVWYHEEASKLGEYVAMVLLDQLLTILPAGIPEEELEKVK